MKKSKKLCRRLTKKPDSYYNLTKFVGSFLLTIVFKKEEKLKEERRLKVKQVKHVARALKQNGFLPKIVKDSESVNFLVEKALEEWLCSSGKCFVRVANAIRSVDPNFPKIDNSGLATRELKEATAALIKRNKPVDTRPENPPMKVTGKPDRELMKPWEYGFNGMGLAKSA